MRITIPKEAAEEAEVYLRAWWDLRHGKGLDRAKRVVVLLRVVSMAAGAALVAGVVLAWQPAAVALAGIALGYAGAESASLRSRLRTWPHNQEYLDWEAIGEAFRERGEGRPTL